MRLVYHAAGPPVWFGVADVVESKVWRSSPLAHWADFGPCRDGQLPGWGRGDGRRAGRGLEEDVGREGVGGR